jgi:hypothetical protein
MPVGSISSTSKDKPSDSRRGERQPQVARVYGHQIDPDHSDAVEPAPPPRHRGRSGAAWKQVVLSLDADDDFAGFCAPILDIRQGFSGRIEREDAVDDRSDLPGVNECGDFA